MYLLSYCCEGQKFKVEVKKSKIGFVDELRFAGGEGGGGIDSMGDGH